MSMTSARVAPCALSAGGGGPGAGPGVLSTRTQALTPVGGHDDRMKVRDVVAVLALLPVDALSVGFGWTAVIWQEEPTGTPTGQLAVICALLAVIVAVLWATRLRNAALLQTVPVLMLVWLMFAP